LIQEPIMTLYMFFAGLGILIYTGVASVVAAIGGPSEAPGVIASKRSPAVVVAAESTQAQTAGEKLFQELGCINCHRPEGAGIGPALTGVFGRPVTDPGCGSLTVDEQYLRESILNPSATVAAGFAPVMPTFAGKVTEEQLRALIAYVKSLSVPIRGPRKP
jgi:cytochrome c2